MMDCSPGKPQVPCKLKKKNARNQWQISYRQQKEQKAKNISGELKEMKEDQFKTKSNQGSQWKAKETVTKNQ